MQAQHRKWLLLIVRFSLIALLAVFIQLSIPEATLTVHAGGSMTEQEPPDQPASDLGTGISYQHTGWLFYLTDPYGNEVSTVKAQYSYSTPAQTNAGEAIANMGLITINGTKFTAYDKFEYNAPWGPPFDGSANFRGNEVKDWLLSDPDGDGHLKAAEIINEWWGEEAALKWETKEVYLVFENFQWGRVIKDGKTTGYWFNGTAHRWGVMLDLLDINADNAGDPITKKYTNNVFPNCVTLEACPEIELMELNAPSGGGQLLNNEMYTTTYGKQKTGRGIGIVWNGNALTSTYDEPLGSKPGPAPNDKDKIKPGEPTANIVKFYEDKVIKGEEVKIKRSSFTRTPTPRIIAIETEVPTGYKLKGWYTSSTFKSASGSSPIYDEYKSSMDNIQTGSSAKTITLGSEETTLYLLLVKSKMEEVEVEADRILYESELSKAVNVGSPLESQDVTYSLHALQCKGHCPGYCPGHDDEYCTGTCKDGSKTCSGHEAECPDDEKCAKHDDGECSCATKTYCTMTLVDKALDFKRANSNLPNDFIAQTAKFKDWVKPAIATRSGVAAYDIVKNYNYAYVLHRGTEDKATLCNYKPEAGNSIAAELFKLPKKNYKSNEDRVENGQYSGKIPITLLEKGADKETSAKSATCTATDTASASVNPAVEESVIVKVYRGIEREVDTKVNPAKIVRFTTSSTDMTAGKQLPSRATINFYPYIRMTIQNIDADGEPLEKQEVNVLSEFNRQIVPNDYAEIIWSLNPANLHIHSLMWSMDKRLTSGSEVWQQPNKVLKGGAEYELSTTNQTVTVQTYQTIVLASFNFNLLKHIIKKSR